MTTIGGRLGRARQDAGYATQPAFHKALLEKGYKVSRETVTRWEGKTLPPEEVWPYLEALKIDLRLVFFGPGPEESAGEAEFIFRMRNFYRAMDPRGRRSVIHLAEQQVAESPKARTREREQAHQAAAFRPSLPTSGEPGELPESDEQAEATSP